MKVAHIVEVLETVAPPSLAEDWDNVGLLIGRRSTDVRKIMLCVDLTRPVLAEAVRAGVQMVLAYHPVIFQGVRRLTARAEPVVYEAARRDMAVYCLHTAFDVVAGGTNDILADALGLTQTRPLQPTVDANQCKIVVFVPPQETSQVAGAAFAAGAGRIGNYHDSAFFSHGIGTFCGGHGSHPSVGQAGHHETAEEMRLEVIAPASRAAGVCDAIRAAHSYETPAIDVYPLANRPKDCGMGRVGAVARPVAPATLISRIKKATGLKKVLLARAAARGGSKSNRVATAACGAGSCGSLFRKAVDAKATFYLTGEMRHHDLLPATAGGLTVVCLGHSNSERIAMRTLAKRLAKPLEGISLSLSLKDKDPLEVA